MTSKILGWATFSIITLGALPILSNASFAPGLSSQVDKPLPLEKLTALPTCGKCNVKPPILFTTTYAIDEYNICQAPTIYRLFGRTNQKVMCQFGHYWFCDDSSTNLCSTFIERPSCPDNTCIRTNI